MEEEEDGGENDATDCTPSSSIAHPPLFGSGCIVSDDFHMELFDLFSMVMHFNLLPLLFGEWILNKVEISNKCGATTV